MFGDARVTECRVGVETVIRSILFTQMRTHQSKHWDEWARSLFTIGSILKFIYAITKSPTDLRTFPTASPVLLH